MKQKRTWLVMTLLVLFTAGCLFSVLCYPRTSTLKFYGNAPVTAVSFSGDPDCNGTDVLLVPESFAEEDRITVCSDSNDLVVIHQINGVTVRTYESDFLNAFTEEVKKSEAETEQIIRADFLNSVIIETDLLRKLRSVMIAGVWLILILTALLLKHLDYRLRTKSKGNQILQMIPVFVMCLLSIELTIGYHYLRTNYPDMTLMQLNYYATTNLDGANAANFSRLFLSLGLGFLAAVFLTAVIRFISNRLEQNLSREDGSTDLIGSFALRWGTVLAALIWVTLVFTSFWNRFEGNTYLTSLRSKTGIYHKHYVSPKDTVITAPEDKKNLVYLFLESMETGAIEYPDTPGGKEHLIPGLEALAQTETCFNGNSERVHGAHPLTGTTWTISGMIAETAGIGVQMSNEESNWGEQTESFLPGAVSIGDLLEQQGYQNCIMMGSNSFFANRFQYFRQHGNYEVLDYEWAKREGLIPEDYYVWWGFEDEKLYSFAKDKLTDLAESGQPFNFSLLTADTHFTDGYRCSVCPDQYQKQYSNVLACADHLVCDLIDWIQAQPWGEDTVIVLCGDHLYPDSFYQALPEDAVREVYFCIINSEKAEPAETRYYSTMDVFPTTLSALGFAIEGNRLGMGTDLFSDTPTLTEQYGIPYLDYQFGLKSDFYTEWLEGHTGN